MARKQPIEIFMPPNVIKAKVGGGGRGLDLDAIQRAEMAIEKLSESFGDWIASDVDRLVAARTDYENSPSDATFGALYRVAHDLKGQGKTFNFSLMARVASSLCALTETSKDGRGLPVALIDGHIDAIKVILRMKLRDPNDRTATVLAAELEAKVAAFRDKLGKA